MNRAAIAAIAAVVLLSGVGGYLGSPYYTANQVRVAARNADRQRLEQLVDFPQVREHFKSQLNSQVEKGAGNSSTNDNPLAGIGAKLISAFSGRLIDRVVTPDNVAAIISSGRAARAAERGDSSGTDHGVDRPAPEHGHSLDVTGSYKGLDHFLVTIRDTRDPETAGAVLTLTRNGLFSWRVTQIDLPGLLDKTDAGSAPN